MMLLYLRYYLVLTMLSMIGLALPSDHGASVTTRKLAKGSKKNPPLLFREAIAVGMEAPQMMSVQKLKATVNEIMRDIVSDNIDKKLCKRRFLSSKAQNPVSVETTELTPTDCADNSSASVACYTATVNIVSEVNILKAIVKLKDLLVKGVTQNGLLVTGQASGQACRYPVSADRCPSCCNDPYGKIFCAPPSKLVHCPATAPCSTTATRFRGDDSVCTKIVAKTYGLDCNEIVAYMTMYDIYYNCMEDPNRSDGVCATKNVCEPQN